MTRKAYFLSDLHLGAPYFPDSREAERRVVAFLESIRHDAAEIYLLGDILDYWYEYRYVVPRGFVRFFGKLAELADSGVKITWMIGNHDIWIFDYIPEELGIEVADGILERDILGTRFLLSHGDGIPPLPASFRMIRRLFRNRICQRLFAGIHPRWTVPFAHRWSRHSRATGMPPMQKSHPLLQNLVDFSKRHAAKNPGTAYYIFGHLHILHRRRLETSVISELSEYSEQKNLSAPELIVLGEWLHTFSYAVFDGVKLSLHRFEQFDSDSNR